MDKKGQNWITMNNTIRFDSLYHNRTEINTIGKSGKHRNTSHKGGNYKTTIGYFTFVILL